MLEMGGGRFCEEYWVIDGYLRELRDGRKEVAGLRLVYDRRVEVMSLGLVRKLTRS